MCTFEAPVIAVLRLSKRLDHEEAALCVFIAVFSANFTAQKPAKHIPAANHDTVRLRRLFKK